MIERFHGTVATAHDSGFVSNRRDLVGAVGMVVLGLVAIANPLWLESVTDYPGTDWTFLPLVHAAFTTIGLIGLASGLHWIRTGTPCPTVRTSAALAGIAIVGVPLYWHVALTMTGISEPLLEGYGARRSFIAGMVMAGYLLGVSIGTWDRRQLSLALVVPIPPGTLVAIEWTDGGLLTPVLEAHFFFTGAPVLAIPRLGTWVIAGVIILGYVVARLGSDSDEPREERSA